MIQVAVYLAIVMFAIIACTFLVGSLILLIVMAIDNHRLKKSKAYQKAEPNFSITNKKK